MGNTRRRLTNQMACAPRPLALGSLASHHSIRIRPTASNWPDRSRLPNRNSGSKIWFTGDVGCRLDVSAGVALTKQHHKHRHTVKLAGAQGHCIQRRTLRRGHSRLQCLNLRDFVLHPGACATAAASSSFPESPLNTVKITKHTHSLFIHPSPRHPPGVPKNSFT